MQDLSDKTILDRVNHIFDRQKKNSLILRGESLSNRIKRLRSLKKWIDSNDKMIQKGIYDDFKKPAGAVDVSEIYPVLTELKDAIANLKRWVKDTKVDTSVAYLGTAASVKYEPKGVCLIISPWNFPFLLTVGPLISALTAGNTVIIKPSEMTPHTSEIIDKMIGDLYKEDHVAVFKGDAAMSQMLLKLPFDHIFFTGSPQVGKVIMRAAAEHLTSVTLELGGKSPTVVDETANIRDAAQKIAWGKFINNGQTCVAPDYILVHESIQDQFLSELRQYVSRLFDAGNQGFKQSEDYARVVNQKHLIRLLELVDDAVSLGAKLAIPKEVDEEDCYLSPVILTQVSFSARVMQEEVFGPVLPVLTFSSLDEVITQVNEQPKPLAFYYFGRSRKTCKKLLSQTSSGTFCINDCVLQFGHPHLPFGGVNNSGIGKSHGKYGFLAFSNEKAVLRQRVGLTTTKLVYPPYGKRTQLIGTLLKKYF
ncbi:MAG: aldehyde dehydrogenase family protein [Bacteroidota bacterium]